MANFGKRIGNMVVMSKVDFDRLIWQLEAKDSQIKVRDSEIKKLRNELANFEINKQIEDMNRKHNIDKLEKYLSDLDDLGF